MLRRLRHDVLDQLPARTDTRVPVDLTADQREAHAELDLPIARIVAMARRRPLTQAEFLRLMSLLTTQRIICNGMAQLNFKSVWPGVSTIAAPDDALLRSLSSPKLVELRELIANVAIEQRRKVVVFSQWRRMLELANWGVGDLLARARIRAVFFTGEESQRRRTQNLVDFHDDSNTRVLFATDAGGVGLNLQRAATCCINIELPWNPAVLEQRIGRIHRLGQKSPIDVYCLVSESGIESRILDLVGNKKALFSGLFDGSSDQVLFERSGSFLSRVEKLVEPVVVPELDEAATEESEQLLQTEVLPGDERPLPLSEVVTPTAAGPAAPPVVQEGKPTLVSVPVPPGGDIVRLLGQLSIRRAQGGGVTIEAPAEAATALAAVLRGLAQQIVGELTL